MTLCLLALSVWCRADSQESGKRPNIVIVYADDLGFGDVQCYNEQRGMIPTPNIDALAAAGMRFTDAHSSSGVCSPSRYTLLTGRYHWRTRLQRGIVGLWGKPVIHSDRLTLGGLVRKRDYRTFCIGKWHLGWNWPIDSTENSYFQTGGYGGKKDIVASASHRSAWARVFSQAIPGGPTAVGFDEYFGVDVPNWPPYCFIEGDRTLGIPTEFAAAKLFAKNQASVQGPALAEWTLEPILPELGKRAVEVIEREAKSDDPFLIYLSLTSPHTPLSVNESWKGKSGLGLYADFVMETDALVGRVIGSLAEQGIANETLVLFTSDNGCAPYIGVEALERKGHYPSGPLRGYKSDVWEGGHRIPFIVRWPEVISPGNVYRGLIHQADLMATFADILGLQLAPNSGEDSFSFYSVLKGDEQGAVREHSVSCSIQGLPSFRSGLWKYIPGQGSGGWTKGEDASKIQLYDLSSDLSETRNLAAENPERVASMASLFETIINDGRSRPGPKQLNEVDVVRFPVEKNRL